MRPYSCHIGIVLALVLAFCLLCPAVSPALLTNHGASSQDLRTITVSFIDQGTITQQVTVSSQTIHTLASLLTQTQSRLTAVKTHSQALSVIGQTLTALGELRILPPAIHQSDVMRQITKSLALAHPDFRQLRVGSGSYVNSACLLYLSSFGSIDLTIWTCLGYLLWLTETPVWAFTAVLQGLGLMLLFYSQLHPLRFMDIITVHGWTDTYFTLGLNGIKYGNDHYGDPTPRTVLGFTGLKITIPVPQSVENLEEIYLGCAGLVLK